MGWTNAGGWGAHGWGGAAAGGTSYAAETTAWANAVTTAGGTVSTTQKGYVDTLIKGLKADGLWTIQDEIWLLAAENAQQANIGIVNLRTWTLNGTVTRAANGYTNGGAPTDYIDTGFNPATATSPSFVQNSASIFAYVQTDSTAGYDGVAIGNGSNVNGGSRILPRYNGDGNLYCAITDAAFTASAAVANANSKGFYIASRTGSGATAAYKNGSSVATGTDASSLPESRNFYVFGDNRVGGIADYDAQTISCVGIGGGFTPTQAANLSVHINGYHTSRGVNVYVG